MSADKQEQPQVDPYKAFFLLVFMLLTQLVQCEKLNSSSFARGIDQELTIDYEWLLSKGIPYN